MLVTVHLVLLDSIFELQIIPAKAVARLLVLAQAAIPRDASLAFRDIIYWLIIPAEIVLYKDV